MSDLTLEAEELLRAGRGAFQPTEDDRVRVLTGLRAQLGGALCAATGVSLVTSTAGGAWLKVTGVLVLLGALGGGVAFSRGGDSAEPARTANAPTAAPALEPTPTALSDAPSTLPASVKPVSTAQSRPQATPPRPPNRLAQEVEILSRAGADVRGGRAVSALQALDEHERKFPSGALAEERSAARVQALCALGRTKDAEAELARLARLSPDSAQSARARKACGAALRK
jgi:hypothetical protein